MPIKRKIVVGLFFILSMSVILNLLIYETVLKPSFVSLEDELVNDRIELTRIAIDKELQALARLNTNISHRDDTYTLMVLYDNALIEQNFSLSNLTSHSLDLFYIYDSDLNLIANLSANDVPANGMVQALGSFLQKDRLNNLYQSGGLNDFIVDEQGKPLLLSATHIHKSDGSGTPRGIIVLGSFLDEQLLNKISSALDFDIRLANAIEQGKLNAAIKSDSGITVMSLLDEQDNNYRNVFIRFSNDNNAPQFWLHTRFQKDVTMLGGQAHEISIIATLAIATLMVVFLFFIFQRYIFQPTSDLTKNIVNISKSPDQSARLKIDGNDEIGLLAHEFNNLLNKLEDTHNQLLEDYLCVQDLSQKLNYQATHDSLTELVNRAEFENRLRRVIRSNITEETGHVVCYIDLDQFKMVNDTCGHEAGDEMLKSIASKLKGAVRKRDTLARLGGDEFAILMEHCSIESAVRVADSIIKKISEFSFSWHEHTFTAGLSIGWYHVNDNKESLSEVIKKADAACYLAKQKGGTKFHIYRSDDENRFNQNRELEWTTRINRAFDEQKLLLATQNILPNHNFGIRGGLFEVLLRVQEDSGEIADPRYYLNSMDKYGLNKRLDRYVIDGVSELAQNRFLDFNDIFMCSINISANSIRDHNFISYANGSFAEAGIAAEKICFEINEALVIANMDVTMTFMEKLKKLGFNLALDDFGSGLSSFAYLKSLPVDFVKIDGVFVQDMINDPISLSMVRSMNEIAKIMGKQTIAENVENEATYNKLIELGVDYLQGHYIETPHIVGKHGDIVGELTEA